MKNKFYRLPLEAKNGNRLMDKKPQVFKMNKKNWIVLLVILTLIALVIIYKDKFIVKEEEIIGADYCAVDSDCVLAVNPYVCCIQLVPMNKKVVELDEEFVAYEEGVDYSDYKKFNNCSNIACAFGFPSGYIICLNNKCSYNESI